MLALLRGMTILTLLFSVVASLGCAVAAAAFGPVALGAPGFIGVYFSLPIAVVLAIKLAREVRKDTHGGPEVASVRSRSVDRSMLGMALLCVGCFVALVSGWWVAALLGGAASVLATLTGAPTRARVASRLDVMLSTPATDAPSSA